MNTSNKIQRGDIFWVTMNGNPQNHVQARNRPAVIVSNNANNLHSSTVEVVFLTTRDKGDLPTHTTINSSAKRSTALCEQIQTVGIEQLEQYVGRCTAEEMAAIDRCLRISLGLDEPVTAGCEKKAPILCEVREPAVPSVARIPTTEEVILTAERDLLRQLYSELINR